MYAFRSDATRRAGLQHTLGSAECSHAPEQSVWRGLRAKLTVALPHAKPPYYFSCFLQDAPRFARALPHNYESVVSWLVEISPACRGRSVPLTTATGRDATNRQTLVTEDRPLAHGHGPLWIDIKADGGAKGILEVTLCTLTAYQTVAVRVRGATSFDLEYLRESGEWCRPIATDCAFTMGSYHDPIPKLLQFRWALWDTSELEWAHVRLVMEGRGV